MSARFQSPQRARWLPRVLALSMVFAGAIVAWSIDPDRRLDTAGLMRLAVLVAAAAAGWWFLRGGGDTATVFEISGRNLDVIRGQRRERFPLERLMALDYAPPFAGRGAWLPAVLMDFEGQTTVRVPTVLTDGTAWLAKVLDGADNPRVTAWADAKAVDAKLAAAGRVTTVGYLLALVPPVAALILRASEIF